MPDQFIPGDLFDHESGAPSASDPPKPRSSEGAESPAGHRIAPGAGADLNLDLGRPVLGDGHRPGYPGYGDGNGYGTGLYGGSDEEVHLLDYVRILYKRRWTAATAFIIVLGTVIVYTFTATPIYQGKTQILIEPENPNVVSFKEVVELDRAASEYYQTQYRILQSRALARRAITSEKLWQHPEFGGGPPRQKFSLTNMVGAAIGWASSTVKGMFGSSSNHQEPPNPSETALQSRVIDAFLGHLAVTPVRNSRLVDVFFESEDPALSAQVVNAIARQYIEQNLEFKFLTTKEASDWLGERLAEERKKVEASELALQRYREQVNAVAIEDRQNIVVQRLADLNAAVTKARTERIEKEGLFRQLQGIQNDHAALDTFPGILSNTFIQQLKGQLADMQRQEAQLAERLGDKHPEMGKLRSAISTASAKLQGEIAKVVQSVRNEYLAAERQERTLTEDLDRQKTEALALNRKGIEYGVLQREAESNRQIYQSLLQRAKETGVSGALKTSNIRVVDTAEVPRSPLRPQRMTNLLLGLFGGALFGLGLVFFFEYLDNRIRTPEDIKHHLGLPWLGMVPALKTKAGDYPLINNGAPANFLEAFRNIRTNVLFSSPEEGARSLVVTSTQPDEGKTLVAANLALSLAQGGQRVLLIDADLRRGSLSSVFGQKPEPGLSNVLAGHTKPSEALHKSATQDLWVLGSGRIPPNPAELLGSKRFKELLGSALQHFDWVIIDSPPVMAVTDASVVAHSASGVLFVVGAEQTNRHAAHAALEQLEAAKAPIAGAVLNRVDLERNSYYYSLYYKTSYQRYYGAGAKT